MTSQYYTIKEQIVAVINSADRLNPLTESVSNFTYSFNENLSRITDITVSSVQIPYAFYAINNNNNTLTLNGGANTVTISNGNYTISTLQTELITKIDAIIAGNTSASFNTTTMKLTIGNDAAFIVDSMVDQPTSTLAPYLGFLTSSASSTSNTADSVINISGPNYIYVKSIFLTKNIHNKTIYANDNLQNALVVIPIDINAGNVLINPVQTPLLLGGKTSIASTDIIDISLCDENHNEVDMNGINWAIELKITTK